MYSFFIYILLNSKIENL